MADESMKWKKLALPVPALWLSVIWAMSPALVLTSLALMFGRDWRWLGWAAFIVGVLNLGVFSLWQLGSRGVEHWEFKSIPLALLLLIANMALFVGLSVLFGVPVGAPASPGATP